MSDERLAISEYSEYRDAINDERLAISEDLFCQQIAQETVFFSRKDAK